MIEKLTKEQEDSIPAYVDKWIKLGESTERVDPQAMRDAINELYDSIGMERVPIYVMDSPMGCIIAANQFRKLEEKNAGEKSK